MTARLQKGIDQLDELHKRWTATQGAAAKSAAPPATLEQIDETLAALAAAQSALTTRQSGLLADQAAVATVVARSNAALALIAEKAQTERAGLFSQQDPPVWSGIGQGASAADMAAAIDRAAHAYASDVVEYWNDPSSDASTLVAIFIVIFLVFLAARHSVRQWRSGGQDDWPTARVFDHPYAGALAAALFVATAPGSSVPTELKQTLEFLAILAMIRVTLPVIRPVLVPALGMLVLLFGIDTVRQVFAGTPPAEQVILLAESLAAAGLLGWAFKFGALQPASERARGVLHPRLVRWLAIAALAATAAGFVAAGLGFVRLARLLTPGAIAAGVLAFELYATVQVADGLVGFLLRARPLGLTHMAVRHRDLLQRRAHTLLTWGAVFAWGKRTLEYLGLLEPTSAWLGGVLSAQFERGAVSISLGAVLEFAAALVGAYLLSRFIRFALEEDVHSRLRTNPGLSFAIGALLHYTILTLGFVFGLGLLGVDLTKVTVLLSAVGVGLGFGLQSVVNNFASGLILLFERPIQVGDVVDVGDIKGQVRRIGIRATTVRTALGADTILPNSLLVEGKLTNWTFSDQHRRIDLPLAVNFGVSPATVVELLQRIARENPAVLKHPAPEALLVGYGSSTLNFELRAWTDRFDQWAQVQSELAIAVYDEARRLGKLPPLSPP